MNGPVPIRLPPRETADETLHRDGLSTYTLLSTFFPGTPDPKSVIHSLDIPSVNPTKVTKISYNKALPSLAII